LLVIMIIWIEGAHNLCELTSITDFEYLFSKTKIWEHFLKGELFVCKSGVYRSEFFGISVECGRSWVPFPIKDRVIPKTLKILYQWFPCLALIIKKKTLTLSQKANSKKQSRLFR